MADNFLPKELTEAASALVGRCSNDKLTIATAESCTGGLVSAAITEIAGSSAAFLAGYVTYSNEAKCDMLGVEMHLIEQNGAVSAPVAAAMASGALERSEADVAVSITGIAGPGGGSIEKPIGTVIFGLAKKGSATQTFHQEFPASQSRSEIRIAAASYALELLLP